MSPNVEHVKAFGFKTFNKDRLHSKKNKTKKHTDIRMINKKVGGYAFKT